MDNNVVSFSQIVSSAFKNINCQDVENANTLFDVWKKILYSIKGYSNECHSSNPYEGKNLYEHTKIIDLKNGVLFVEADHPGWIQLLQLHKKYILTGIKKFSPELKITSLAFKLKSNSENAFSENNESELVNKTREEIQQYINKAEQDLQTVKIEEQKKEPVELPDELKAIFEDLKNSVLTNSKE